MKVFEKIKNIINLGRTHENVNRIFWSPYFKRHIVVTAYISDKNWKFRFYEKDYTETIKASTPLSHFIENGLERPELPWDKMNKLKQYR